MQSIPADISVVAGGWSVKQIDHSRIPGYVIAVNDSAMYLPRVDCVVSMDRLWTELRWPVLVAKQTETWLRRAATKNLKIEGYEWLHVFDCDNESTRFIEDGLNGTNSGMCAFNRAYQMRPRRIWLFGFDGQLGPNGEKHWYPDYEYGGGTKPGKLKQWSQEYSVAKELCDREGIHIFNVGRSAIPTFERISADEFNKEGVACLAFR